jgi:hypothetical protein
MASYWVDKDTGNNGNPGSQAQPWETIEYAMETAGLVAGDIVRVVKAATAYNEDFQITAGDYSANPIVLRVDDYADPAVVDKGTWSFNTAKGYTISGFDYNGFTNHMFQLGFTSETGNIIIERSWFRHSAKAAIRIQDIDTLTIDQCVFRDLRQRVAGQDRNAIIFSAASNAIDVTISDCFFEDIGSDGVHVLSGANVDGLTITGCVAGINRPYSAVGTSWYNGDVTTWQDFSTNVGENAFDIKGGGTLVDILVEYCLWFGFQTTVAGQDASGASGEGMSIHDEAENVTVRYGVGYANDRGAQISGTTGTSDDITVDHCFFHDNDDYGISARDQIRLTVTNCQIVSNNVNLRFGDNVDFQEVTDNMFIDGTYTRGVGNTGESNFDFNLWKSGAPPAQWAGGNDYTEATALVKENDTLAGIIELVHQFTELAFTVTQLQYHPGLADLYTAIGLAMMAGTTTTIVQEDTAPTQRFSVLLEQ